MWEKMQILCERSHFHFAGKPHNDLLLLKHIFEDTETKAIDGDSAREPKQQHVEFRYHLVGTKMKKYENNELLSVCRHHQCDHNSLSSFLTPPEAARFAGHSSPQCNRFMLDFPSTKSFNVRANDAFILCLHVKVLECRNDEERDEEQRKEKNFTKLSFIVKYVKQPADCLHFILTT